MSDPTRDYLTQVQARANAATEGPWYTTQAADEESTTWIEHASGDVLNHDERGHGHMRENFSWMRRADAEFIAHAREDVPRLVAALTAVLDRCDDYERVFEVMGGDMAASEAHVARRIREVVTEALGEES